MDRFAFDDQYVLRLREHDAGTERHFHDYFQPRVFVRLRRRLRSVADVEEVRQETYRRVLAKIYAGELRDGRTLPAFLFTVCDNVLLEHYRRSARTEQLDEQLSEPADDCDIEASIISAERQQIVQDLLGDLKPQDAGILRAMLEEVPRDEICQRFGVSSSYLRVLLHRARKRFRDIFSRSAETKPPKRSLRR